MASPLYIRALFSTGRVYMKRICDSLYVLMYTGASAFCRGPKIAPSWQNQLSDSKCKPERGREI